MGNGSMIIELGRYRDVRMKSLEGDDIDIDIDLEDMNMELTAPGGWKEQLHNVSVWSWKNWMG